MKRGSRLCQLIQVHRASSLFNLNISCFLLTMVPSGSSTYCYLQKQSALSLVSGSTFLWFYYSTPRDSLNKIRATLPTNEQPNQNQLSARSYVLSIISPKHITDLTNERIIASIPLICELSLCPSLFSKICLIITMIY